MKAFTTLLRFLFLPVPSVVWGKVPGGGERRAAAEEAPRFSRLAGESQERWASQLCLAFITSLEVWNLSSALDLLPLNQSSAGTQPYLPKAWPCWATRRTTQPCPGLCPSWQSWRTRWSSCIRSRQPATSSSLRNCWLTTFVCWGLFGWARSCRGDPQERNTGVVHGNTGSQQGSGC